MSEFLDSELYDKDYTERFLSKVFINPLDSEIEPVTDWPNLESTDNS